MRISKSAAYGIVIVQELGKADVPMIRRLIAEKVGLGAGHVQQILIPLVREGLVASRLGGPGVGGYSLVKTKRRISVLDVVLAMRESSADSGIRNERAAVVARKVEVFTASALGRLKIDRL
jgi:DNA-binding IscR family transcriptional regulator